ncbi:MAG: pilin [Candidatus Saccharimonadales bacterium]
MITLSLKTKILAASLLFVGVIGFGLGAPTPASAALKTNAQVEDAARANCTSGNSDQKSACRNGFRHGYGLNAETKQQACEENPNNYNIDEKVSCRKGYDAGKAARAADEPAAAAGPSAPGTANACNTSFFGFPKWDKYLEKVETCAPKLNSLGDIWLILLAIIELLLRVAILVAIAFVMIGGFKYITSQANPEKTTRAKNTVIDGLVGLVIAIIATAVVSFIAGRFQG